MGGGEKGKDRGERRTGYRRACGQGLARGDFVNGDFKSLDLRLKQWHGG